MSNPDPTWQVDDDNVELTDEAVEALAALLLDTDEGTTGKDAGGET